jgi:hypothetical protein
VVSAECHQVQRSFPVDHVARLVGTRTAEHEGRPVNWIEVQVEGRPEPWKLRQPVLTPMRRLAYPGDQEHVNRVLVNEQSVLDDVNVVSGRQCARFPGRSIRPSGTS